jgi:hypothetical protein
VEKLFISLWQSSKLSSVFDNAVKNMLPGVPWKRTANDEVLFSVASPETTEG